MRLTTLLPGPMGFGTAPLGNMFRAISEEEASATLHAAWDQGIRYYDTAPFYGAGLAETRLGTLLSQHPRDSYVLSTKVGRIVLDEIGSGGLEFSETWDFDEESDENSGKKLGEKGGLFEHGRPNRIVYDYSADGVERSIEDSLKRMGVDRLDFVTVHDIAQDFHGDAWLQQFEIARTGAFRALTRLREQGVIQAWGLGTNRVEPIELVLALDEPRPDGFLLAGRYTLLDHERALQRLLPAAAEQQVDMVVGGPYNSGVLAGGSHFEYQQAPPETVERVRRIKEIAYRHGITVRAAALQFSLAHPVAAAVIPGASRPSRMAENLAALREDIPAAFWAELRQSRLVSLEAPLPGGV